MNIIGTPADDVLADTPPGAGDDELIGRGGDDTLESGNGRDTLKGGAGFDIGSFAGRPCSVNVDLAAGFEGDSLTRLRSIEGVIGSAFGDSITGDADANWLHGGDGEDVLDGGAGADTLLGGAGDDVNEGGDGFDVVSYAGAPGAVSVDLAAQIGSGWGVDTLLGVEGLVGTAFDDSLAGDAADNALDGGTAGRDSLAGGLGFDTASFADRGSSVAVDLAAGSRATR
jgi:Ca2+-binding RTX toxin-like protein